MFPCHKSVKNDVKERRRWLTVDGAVPGPDHLAVGEHGLVGGEVEVDVEGRLGARQGGRVVPDFKGYVTALNPAMGGR